MSRITEPYHSDFESGSFVNPRLTERIRWFVTPAGRTTLQQAFVTDSGRTVWSDVPAVHKTQTSEIRTAYRWMEAPEETRKKPRKIPATGDV